MTSSSSGSNAARLGEAAFSGAEKVSAEFFAISYGAFVQHLLATLPQDDNVEELNQQLETAGRHIGSRLVEEYCVRSNAPPCRSFAQAAEGVALTGLRMFLNVAAEVSAIKDSADSFSITFAENPLNLFVELPDGALRDRLWYSNVLCGVISGALVIVGFQAEARYVRDTLRGDSTNEIIIVFKGREKETFQLEH